MKVGDEVRVKHPTGGILPNHRFRIEEVPEDPDGWVVIRGDIGGTHGPRDFRFHRYSLEVTAASTNVHPDTAKRERAEADLKVRINKFTEAVVLRKLKKADADYVDRCEGELLQGIQNFKDACYAELDDEHGLGKAGLDAARDLVEHATVFHSAHVIDTERLENLAEAIGLERQD